jgi:hypothetical protein
VLQDSLPLLGLDRFLTKLHSLLRKWLDRSGHMQQETHPVCQQLAWKDGVDANLWPRGPGETFHELQAGGFGDGIRQATTTLGDSLEGGRGR